MYCTLQIHRDLHVTAVLSSDARLSSIKSQRSPLFTKELVPFMASLCIEKTQYQLPCSRTLDQMQRQGRP
jgi:hypothetical protein